MIITSTMISDRMYEKLSERRAAAFGASLEGIKALRVIRDKSNQYDLYRDAISSRCNIDAIPTVSWSYPIEEAQVLGFICSRISQLASGVVIPVGALFVINCEIVDWCAFARSIWNFSNTKDITLFVESASTVISVQDLEYSIAYFELLL